MMETPPISYLEKYCPLPKFLIQKTGASKIAVKQDTNSKRKHTTVFQLPAFPDISISCYTSIANISFEWDLLASSSSALLQRSFLRAIEEAPPRGMEFRYLAFYKNEQLLGIAYFQLLAFKADQSLRIDTSETKSVRLKKWIARQFNNTLLFAGNTMLTGQHAYHFSPGTLSEASQAELIKNASWQLATHYRNGGQSIDAIVHKDIPAPQLSAYRSWRQSAYHELSFQPHMQTWLRPGWRSMDDFVNAMSSKYRVRFRRAADKSQKLTRRWLTTKEISQHSQTMFALYRQIADQADFNLVFLHQDYFSSLKKWMGDQFEVLAYFEENEMVGFCSLLHNGDRAEAHFLGYKSAVNRPTQLYLNMLYDLIQAGIDHRKTHIGFARTAMEIKSSVGAEPEEIYTLVRSYNPLPNRIIPPIVKLLKPERTWKQRRPFKQK